MFDDRWLVILNDVPIRGWGPCVFFSPTDTMWRMQTVSASYLGNNMGGDQMLKVLAACIGNLTVWLYKGFSFCMPDTVGTPQIL